MGLRTAHLLAALLALPALALPGCQDRDAREAPQSDVSAEEARDRIPERDEFVTRVRTDLDAVQLRVRELESSLGPGAQATREDLDALQRDMAKARERLQQAATATGEAYQDLHEDLLQRLDRIHGELDEIQASIRTGEAARGES